VENQDGTVAARSRALFAQLRSRREARATDDRTSAGEEPAGEPVVYDYAADEELAPGSDATQPGLDAGAGAPAAQSGGEGQDGGVAAADGLDPVDAGAAVTTEDGAVLDPPSAGAPPLAATGEAGGVLEPGVVAEPEAVVEPEVGSEAPLAAEPEGVPPSGDPPHPATTAALAQDEDEPVVVGGAPALADLHPAGDALAPAGLNGTAEEAHVSGRHPAADIPLPRIVAIANQKGGVGKTTTAVNLGAALAELGFRTLIVDLDPQGNATTGLGVNARNLEHAIYDVLMHELPIDECIEPTSVRNLFVAPATIDLAGAEIELVPAFSRELRLRKALAELAGEYEFTIIDCPPSLGLLTVNGLAAAGDVIVPIQCEYYALEGLSQLLRNVNLVQSNLNPSLDVSAIILTMYDARTKLSDQVAAEVRQHFGAKVCRNVVPRTVRLSEAPSFGQPIIVFDSSSRGALAYRELAKEVSGGAPQRTG